MVSKGGDFAKNPPLAVGVSHAASNSRLDLAGTTSITANGNVSIASTAASKSVASGAVIVGEESCVGARGTQELVAEGGESVEDMLDALDQSPAALPLLQFTASRLWDARDRDNQRITQDSYDTMGGIEGALATHADSVLTGLTTSEQRLARILFTSLVSEERTRAIISLDELRASVGGIQDTDDDIESVVRHLAGARLVLMETDAERGVTMELIHESLIARWPRLVQGLDEYADAAQFRRRRRAASDTHRPATRARERQLP